MHTKFQESEQDSTKKKNSFAFIFLEGLNSSIRGRTSVATKDPNICVFLVPMMDHDIYIQQNHELQLALNFLFLESHPYMLQEILRNSKNVLCCFYQNKY
ncbi:hypothetical protein JHK82_037218 [Glycine max]|uniref:Uncharacterized protein n=2 Tax=Glycine subgen. Soja TaxID=1462606 RepID=A0A0R0H263_SOYBN|nr:hypothetical protein JHK85_037975 [Glycine max]KAG5113949.1 hypothetical protein JHK82_037218 [Glycine max]KAG5131230.1 hypothetical protein JHK84_037627 [Glycine max]RZB82723.1 hypothetical protein D0Y65_031703 [Glycine soja]